MAAGFGKGDIVAYLGVGNLDDFKRLLGQADDKVKDSERKMNLAFSAIAAAGAAMFVGAVTKAAEFETAMANVNTIAGLSATELESLSGSILKIGQNIPQNLPTLTKGLYDLVSSGVPASQAVDALALAAKAASAGLSSVDIAVQAGMANINAYGLPVEDLTRIFDLQFQTVNLGVTTYTQLAGAMGNILPAASALKVPLEEMYAAIAQLTLVGIDPNSATTYLMNMFDQMVQKAEKWDQAGYPIYNKMTGQFRGLSAILGDLAKSLEGKNTQEQMAILSQLDMEQRGGKALKAIINNFDRYEQILGQMDESAGSMNDAFEIQIQTFNGQLQLVKNSLTAAATELGKEFLPLLKDMLTSINENPEAFRGFVTMFAELVLILGTLATATKGIQAIQSLLTLSWGPAALAITGVAMAIAGLSAALDASRERKLKDLVNTDDIDELYTKLAGLNQELERALTYVETTGGQVKGIILENLFGLSANPANSIADISGEIKVVKDKIAELEGVTNITAPSVKVLSDNLKSSSDNAKELAEKAYSVKDNFMELKDPVETGYKHIKIFGTDSLNASVNIKELGKQSEDAGEKVKQQNYNWIDYAEYLGNIIDKLKLFGNSGQAIKGGLNIVSTAFAQLKSGGLDPVSLAMMGINLAIDLFNTKKEPIVLTVEQVIQKLGIFGQEINNIKLKIDALPGSFDSALIEGLQRSLDASVESMRTAGRISFGAIEIEAKEYVDAINELLEGFVFDETFQEIYDSLGGITEEALRLLTEYGESFDKQGLIRLMYEQIAAAEALLLTLDPASNAYKNLTDQLEKAYEAMGLLGGGVDGQKIYWLSVIDEITAKILAAETDLQALYALQASYEDGERGQTDIDSLLLLIEELKRQLEEARKNLELYDDATGGLKDTTSDLNDELEDQLYYVQQLNIEYDRFTGFTFDQFDEFIRSVGKFNESGFIANGTLIDMIDKLLLFNISFQNTTVDEQILAWIDQMRLFMGTLDPNSEAYKQMQIALDALLAKFEAARRALDENVIGSRAWFNWLQEISKWTAPEIPYEDGGGSYHSGGLVMHAGGVVAAHSGYLSSADEVITKLQRGEVVLNRQVVNNMGANEAMRLNREGGRPRTQSANQTNVNVIVKEPGPRTNVDIAESVYPVIQYKQRNYEPGRNPYRAA